MSYTAPFIPEFKAQFVRDFPYAVPLAGGGSGAAGTVVLNGDKVASVTVDAPGTGYPAAPTVLLFGGGGVGAVLAATIAANALTAIAVNRSGYGFTSVPQLYISNGDGDNTDIDKVSDYDLQAAFSAAYSYNMACGIFSSQLAYTYAYNLLAAHYLCENVSAGGTGIFGKSEWVTTAKSVGNVRENYEIPDRVLRSPFLAKLSKTTYGSQFLELVSPYLIANMAPFHRSALPA